MKNKTRIKGRLFSWILILLVALGISNFSTIKENTKEIIKNERMNIDVFVDIKGQTFLDILSNFEEEVVIGKRKDGFVVNYNNQNLNNKNDIIITSETLDTKTTYKDYVLLEKAYSPIIGVTYYDVKNTKNFFEKSVQKNFGTEQTIFSCSLEELIKTKHENGKWSDLGITFEEFYGPISIVLPKRNTFEGELVWNSLFLAHKNAYPSLEPKALKEKTDTFYEMSNQKSNFINEFKTYVDCSRKSKEYNSTIWIIPEYLISAYPTAFQISDTSLYPIYFENMNAYEFNVYVKNNEELINRIHKYMGNIIIDKLFIRCGDYLENIEKASCEIALRKMKKSIIYTTQNDWVNKSEFESSINTQISTNDKDKDKDKNINNNDKEISMDDKKEDTNKNSIEINDEELKDTKESANENIEESETTINNEETNSSNVSSFILTIMLVFSLLVFFVVLVLSLSY